MTLPQRVYLTRKDVLTALGGRRQLAKAEASGHLRRVPLAGYKIAHYVRADVVRYLTQVGGFTGPLDGASPAPKTATP
jgi:hypothetical protein